MLKKMSLLCLLSVSLLVLFSPVAAFSSSSCGSGSAFGEGDSCCGDRVAVSVLFVVPEQGRAELVRAAELARDHVNANPSCINLDLQLSIESSQCDRQQALDIFYSHLFNSTTQEVAVIGAGCSLASEALAEVAQYYSISLVSYASSSIALDNRDKFPYFFRTVPSDSLVAVGMAELIGHFNWTRAAIVTQNTDAFLLLTEDLLELLEGKGVDIAGDVVLPRDLSRVTMDTLFPPDVRIIVLNMDPRTARHVVCQAYLGLNWRQSQYVWLTQGWYEARWWEGEGPESVNCTSTQLEEFLYQQRVLGVNHYPSSVPPDQDGTTIAGIMSSRDFEEMGFTRRVSYYVYDAVWALALGLNGLPNTSYGTFDPLATSNVENRAFGGQLRESMNKVTFHGVSGEVLFEGGSRVVNALQILQYNNDSSQEPEGIPVRVASIDVGHNESAVLKILGEIWPSGMTPSDGTPYVVEHYPFLWLVITSNVLAAITIVAAVVCMIFNFIFRKRKLIRLSSPNLNFIVGFGVIVFCTAVFFFAYPPLDPAVLNAYCGVRPWFAAIGYTLCFGTINTKMWRVYYIFHNPKPTAKKKPLKDWHLMLFVAVFLLVDVVILVIATSLDNVRLGAELLNDQEHSSSQDAEGITVSYTVTLCESRFKNLWLGILLGYKAIIQAIGVFLAFKIRKVKIKVLNDSREVVATLYLSSLILAAVIVITLAFGNYINVYTAGYAFGIPLSSVVVLGVVFVSKIVRLYKDPTGSKLFTHMTRDTGGASAVVATLDEGQVHTLQRRVKNLEAQLTNFEQVEPVMNFKCENDGSEYLPQAPRTTNGSKHVQIVITNTQKTQESSSN